MCSNFFQKIARLWESVEKYLEPERPQMTMYHGACPLYNWSKNADTHSEYVILIAFPRQQWFLRTHLNVTFILHCLPCFHAAVTGAACLSSMQYKHFLSFNISFWEEVCTFGRILRHNDVRNFHGVNFFFFFPPGDGWGVGERRSIHPDFLN